MFCSLFGSTEHVVLSAKVGERLHFVGNAITIQHSVLTLTATVTIKVDPIGLVRKAWADQLTLYIVVLFEHQDLSI